MDGTFAAAVTVVVAGALVAWRWWLSDRKEARAHEIAIRGVVVRELDTVLAALPERVGLLEARIKALEWKK